MKQRYYEELAIAMYPSSLLHQFGVNGKVAGSIYAAGEIEGVIPIIHGPRGCGYHYRYSARRRHYPMFDVISSELEQKDIIYGGEEKLYQTVVEVAKEYKPKMIMIIPTPISDIIQDDIEAVVKRARKQLDIPVVGVKSELFSHRDKNYSKNRLKEIANQKMNQFQNINSDIKGCGFTEALFAVVNECMEETEVDPMSVNIETIAWGAGGNQVLAEIAETLNKAGVRVNCQFPSTDYDQIKNMPKGALNIVRRLRWAKRMEQRFGTPFLQINTTGKYSGLNGIGAFYQDIGKALHIEEEMNRLVAVEKEKARVAVDRALEEISKRKILLVTRDIQSLPYLIKKYTEDYRARLVGAVVLLSENKRKSLDITDEVLESLLNRIDEAKELYAPQMMTLLNPEEEQLKQLAVQGDIIMGTSEPSMERLGLPIIHPRHEDISLSFHSYVRSVCQVEAAMKRATNRSSLLLNKLEFKEQYYPILGEKDIVATKEMWSNMWLQRKGK